jgi:hypothetical protein
MDHVPTPFIGLVRHFVAINESEVYELILALLTGSDRGRAHAAAQVQNRELPGGEAGRGRR